MRIPIALSSVAVLFLSLSLQAADAAKPSSEAREKMAAMHDKMALCLRSDKAIKDCHSEMHEQCKEHQGEGSCPMMGKMGKHHKNKHGSDKQDDNREKE